MGVTSSAVFNINYHIVWCPKYRKSILLDEIADFLSDQLKTIAQSREWQVLEMEIMPDHIHLFISVQPFVSPTDIVKVLKGVTAKRMFEKFPKLKKDEFWKSGLWSPSYYVGTAGHVTAEIIKRYIDGVTNRKGKGNSSTG